MLKAHTIVSSEKAEAFWLFAQDLDVREMCRSSLPPLPASSDCLRGTAFPNSKRSEVSWLTEYRARFTKFLASAYAQWESSSVLTTAGALSLAPLRNIASQFGYIFRGEWARATFSHQSTHRNIQTIAPDVESQFPWQTLAVSGISPTPFLAAPDYDQALYTTFTAPLWTLPFNGLPIAFEFASIPPAVAKVIYGIQLVRDVIAGRSLPRGARRRRHRATIAIVLRLAATVGRPFSKTILCQHQRRSPRSADADASKTSLSVIGFGDVAARFRGRMRNVSSTKFSARRNRLVCSQSILCPQYLDRRYSTRSSSYQKAAERVARHPRSMA